MMTTLYNKVASSSLERLAALSDGLFAIAMTLLILEVKVPPHGNVHSDADLWAAICALTPRFVMYGASFLTLGIFWAGQQTQFNHLARTDRDLTWIHIAFLATISIMPFTTSLMGEFLGLRLALVLYWLNILAAGLALYASIAYASRNQLLKEDVTPDIIAALKKRVIIAQALYAVGAALCVFSTLASIAFIVLVQLNYAIAPRFTRS